MTATAPVGVTSAEVALVSDGDYYETARWLIDRATRTLWSSLFIVDPVLRGDKDDKVNRLLRGLSHATWRGVNTKLLIGSSSTHLAISEACHIALAVARTHGVDCRLSSAGEPRGSHIKLVISDDHVLSGSHNWSGGALSDQVQDSLLIASPPLAAYLRTVFLEQWEAAGEGR